MPSDNPTRAEIEVVYADARDDLDTLVDAARRMLGTGGPAKAAVSMTTGLLQQAEWDRILLASVVGAAVVRLAGMVDEPTTPAVA